VVKAKTTADPDVSRSLENAIPEGQIHQLEDIIRSRQTEDVAGPRVIHAYDQAMAIVAHSTVTVEIQMIIAEKGASWTSETAKAL
jgi:hypothetical protein